MNTLRTIGASLISRAIGAITGKSQTIEPRAALPMPTKDAPKPMARKRKPRKSISANAKLNAKCRTRQVVRRSMFATAFADINEKYAEHRRFRRRMARNIAATEWRKTAGAR